MSFNGSEGGPITLNEAITWTTNYRNVNPGDIKSHFFGRDIIKEILDQEGCMGIRIYYGIDDEGDKQLILVGATANEDDMTTGTMADFSVVCPPKCPNSSPLNS